METALDIPTRLVKEVIPWTSSYALPVGIHIRLVEWLAAEGESDLLKS